MAKKRWKGQAPAVAGQQSYTFSGTWIVGEIITATIGNVAIPFTIAAATINTFLDSLVTAWNLLATATYPQFRELTASRPSSGVFRLTGPAGVSLSCTLSTNSASGTIGGGASSAGTVTVASAGPNHWSTAANWSTNAIPVNGDDIDIDEGRDEIKYDLNQAGVTLNSLTISFDGSLGLPEVNRGGSPYAEYRPQDLVIGISGGAATVTLANGAGRIKWNANNTTATVRQYSSGSSLDTDRAANQITGLGSNSEVEVFGGELDLCMRGAETSAVALLSVTEGVVRCGPGVVLTDIKQDGGAALVQSDFNDLIQGGGEITLRGECDYALLQIGGTVNLQSSGATTDVVLQGGTLEKSLDTRPHTFGTCLIARGSTLRDPSGSIVFTAPFRLDNCRLSDVTIDVGINRTFAVSS